MRRSIRNGELLAIRTDRIHHDANGAWWDAEIQVPPNEVRGDVHLVYIRGELEHHDGPNSYDAILCRLQEAFTCEETTKVLLCIDSPGGVVAGLSACTRAIRKMADGSDKPLIGFVNEMCASAAYHLSTACDELYCPDSAIIGAIGVIATMGDQVGADKKMGLNFVTLTSGARKADGHPHVRIENPAIAAEQARVDRSARAFWAVVGRARALSPAAVQGYEAGIFVGKLARKARLVDDVMDFDDLLELMGGTEKLAPPSQTVSHTPTGGTSARTVKPMSLAIKQLLKKTEAALAKATDPKVKARLTSAISTYKAALSAYSKVKKTVKYEAESDDGDAPDPDAPEAEEEEESEAEEEEKGNETDREEDIHVHDDGDDDGGGDEDEDEEEDEEEEEKVAAKSSKAKKAKAKAAAARGALAGLKARVDRIERDTLRRNTDARIEQALARKMISPATAKQLRKAPAAEVTAYLKYAKSPLVLGEHDDATAPDGRSGAELPASVMNEVEKAVMSMPNLDEAGQKAMRATLIEEQRKARANGAGTRY